MSQVICFLLGAGIVLLWMILGMLDRINIQLANLVLEPPVSESIRAISSDVNYLAGREHDRALREMNV